MNNQTPDKKGTMTSVWQEQKKKNEIVKEEPPYNDLISIVKEEPHDFDTEEEESEKGFPTDMAHGVEIKVSD